MFGLFKTSKTGGQLYSDPAYKVRECSLVYPFVKHSLQSKRHKNLHSLYWPEWDEMGHVHSSFHDMQWGHHLSSCSVENEG